MSTAVAEERASSLDIALTLARGVRAEIGGRRLPLSASEGDHMLIVVDNSGAASQFSVGVFITTMSAAIRWFQSDFQPWNTQRETPERSVSYKKFKSAGSRLDDLREFMAVADTCPGLVLSVASPNLSQSILTSRGDSKNHPALEQFRDWSGPDFERLMRTACAISIGMEQFYSHPERWNLLHDTDQILTPERRETAMLWLCSFVSIVRDGELTPILLTTKEEVPDPLFAKALLAVADVAAGGLGSGLKSWNKKYGTAENQFVGGDGDLIEKDEAIALWFAAPTVRLHKWTLSYGENMKQGFVHQIGRRLRVWGQ